MNTQFLVEQMIAGDEKAFEDIVEIYYGKALRLAYLISGNYADSQDIVQETFINCFKNASKIREPQHFESYLNKTLTRKAWEICKKRKQEQPVDEFFDESIADSFSVTDSYIQKEENRLILKTIMSLPVKHRSVVILYYYNNLTTKEIAEITGLFEGTVKSRLSSARKKIKKKLEQSDSYFAQIQKEASI